MLGSIAIIAALTQSLRDLDDCSRTPPLERLHPVGMVCFFPAMIGQSRTIVYGRLSQLAIGAELLRIPHGSNIASLQDATPSIHRLATNIVFLTEL